MKAENRRLEVVKLNLQREEIWRYDGWFIEKNVTSQLIEAFFNREDLHFHGITLKTNDRFLEWYFSDRWYNIFEIHDRSDNRVKGWYCNVTRPAEFSLGKITYVDLALDLLVYPNGTYLILDEDEFAELPLDPLNKKMARQGLNELIKIVKENRLTELFNE